MPLRHTLFYILSIVLVNYLFTVAPLVDLPGGEKWPPVSLAVGFIFVVRDFAQREVGHKILLAMLVGAVLSYVMASPFVAIASAAAFLISELADWAVYTFTRRPLSQRVLLSSLIGTPVDSAVFLAILGHLSVVGVVIMTLSKMLGALAVYWMLKRREQISVA